MNAIQHWIDTPVAAAAGWTLIHFVWEGAAIALALAALLACLRDSRAKYAAACASLMAMAAAPALTLAVLWPSASPAVAAMPRSFAVNWLAVPTGAGPAGPAAPWQGWLAPVWMAGVAAICCWRMGAWMAARRMRTNGVCAAAPDWQARVSELAAQLRVTRPVRLLESCLAEVPVVIGAVRPVILLPVGLATGLRPEQVEALLLHELAHIRRHDYVVNLLQTAIESLLFYHPAVWWVSGVMRAQRENCCDDLVVRMRGNAREYAATLARLETARYRAPEPAVAASGGRLIDRIRRLTNPPQSRVSAAPAVSVALVTMAVAFGFWHARPAQAQPVQAAPAPAAVAQAALPTAAPAAQQADDSASQLTGPYKKWLNEDVAYIITDAERAAFKRLTTDAEREHFIEQFWARRDPTPGTPENEFKQEHYRRIAYTNQHFSSSIPGWKTDRGRLYITYGPPDEIEDHSSATPATQQWRYKYIQGVGTNVIVEFAADAHGEMRMTSDPSQPHNVFMSTGHGRRVLVEVQPDRTAKIMLPLPANVAPYTVQGEIKAADGRVVSTFQDSFVNGDFVKRIAVQPGSYTLTLMSRSTRGEGSTSTVTFTVY